VINAETNKAHINRIIMVQEPRFVIYSLFIWSKQKWPFWRAGFYPAYQSNLKRIQIACLHDQNKSGFFGGLAFFQANQSYLNSF